jgi:hypothetical protein
MRLPRSTSRRAPSDQPSRSRPEWRTGVYFITPVRHAGVASADLTGAVLDRMTTGSSRSYRLGLPPKLLTLISQTRQRGMGTQKRLLDDVRRIQLSLQLRIQLSVLENQPQQPQRRIRLSARIRYGDVTNTGCPVALICKTKVCAVRL